MTIRHRAVPAAAMALVLGLGVASAGCGRYSISSLKAAKAFKDGNAAYQAKDYRKAAERYEAVASNESARRRSPAFNLAFFFLGNSYDQLYKPAKQGDPQNDQYIQKAIENYRKAAETISDPKWKESALRYLAAAYASDKLNDPAKAEPVLKEIIAVDPSDPGNYMALAKLYEDAGRYDDAEAEYTKAKQAKPNDPAVLAGQAGYYNRQGDFTKTIDALEQAAALEPNNPEGYHRVATFYWEKANKDYRLSPAQKKDYIQKGLAMEDKALSLNPNYLEAITYKNILLRLEAHDEKDPKRQKQLLDEADKLRNRVMEEQSRKRTGKG